MLLESKNKDRDKEKNRGEREKGQKDQKWNKMVLILIGQIQLTILIGQIHTYRTWSEPRC